MNDELVDDAPRDFEGNTFAERLRAVRIRRGLTQQQLADRVGVDRVTIAQYEAGRHAPRHPRFLAILTALDCSDREKSDWPNPSYRAPFAPTQEPGAAPDALQRDRNATLRDHDLFARDPLFAWWSRRTVELLERHLTYADIQHVRRLLLLTAENIAEEKAISILDLESETVLRVWNACFEAYASLYFAETGPDAPIG